jgi:hypothetical protein
MECYSARVLSQDMLSKKQALKFVSEVDKLVASNDSITLNEGDGLTVASLPGSNNGTIDRQAAERRAPDATPQTADVARHQRESGDQVNRYLFCALVSESAKRIKATAEKAGESLPMTMIVRGVLRSYRQEAKDRYGALAEPELNLAGLRTLNDKVLKDEIARHSKDRVKNSERRLDHAKQLGDDTKVKVERNGLEQAIELRDRLAERFR